MSPVRDSPRPRPGSGAAQLLLVCHVQGSGRQHLAAAGGHRAFPGRVDANETTFASVADLASAFRRAEAAHGEHEKRTGVRDANWADWYAEYVVRNRPQGAPAESPPGAQGAAVLTATRASGSNCKEITMNKKTKLMYAAVLAASIAAPIAGFLGDSKGQSLTPSSVQVPFLHGLPIGPFRQSGGAGLAHARQRMAEFATADAGGSARQSRSH